MQLRLNKFMGLTVGMKNEQWWRQLVDAPNGRLVGRFCSKGDDVLAGERQLSKAAMALH